MRTEATFSTPFGEGSVTVEDDRLVEVRLPVLRETEERGLAQAAPGAALPDARPPAPATGPIPAAVSAEEGPSAGAPPSVGAAARWARELGSYFRGERTGWTEAEVDLDAHAFTPFRTAVYRALLAVPTGQVVTYGELARRAGRPGAARAVGSAMADNPIAVVVPCHRVVRTDGSLGRYGFGDPWKPFLLRFEGALGGESSNVPAVGAGGGAGPR